MTSDSTACMPFTSAGGSSCWSFRRFEAGCMGTVMPIRWLFVCLLAPAMLRGVGGGPGRGDRMVVQSV